MSVAPAQTPSGWLVGVLVAPPGEAMQRHYYAVGHADRAKAEWTAVDCAVRLGEVAVSPIGGQEPVEALRAFTPARMTSLGLAHGEIRELGWRHPRRWLG